MAIIFKRKFIAVRTYNHTFIHSQHDECKGLIIDDATGEVIGENHTATWEDWETQQFKDCTEAIISSNTRVGGKLDDIQVGRNQLLDLKHK